MAETVCHRAKTKPSVTAIRQMAAGRCRARQGSTLQDQLGLPSATTSGAPDWLPFPRSVLFSLLSPSPLFHPLVYSSVVFLILSVNPALGLFLFFASRSLFKVHFSPFPPYSLRKQGQSCNPFTAPLSTDSTQIILKDLQPRLGTIKGRGVKKSQNAQGKASESHRKGVKREENIQGEWRQQTEGTCVTVI